MPHPYVTKVTLKDGQVVLTIELDPSMAGLPVEIFGDATQNGGGFANFYDVQAVSANPDGAVVMYVKATPFQDFVDGEDVTVVLRASRVWAAVLSQKPRPGGDPKNPAPNETQWNNIRALGWESPGGGSPSWAAARESAGGASFLV